MELVYEGKKSKREILEMIPAANLKEVKKYDMNWFNEWYNMLIFGDALIVLKALMEKPEVKGKVRLVYIDPPFSTGQKYRVGAERTGHISYSNEDFLAYEDTLRGGEYLEFLRERLILLREVMAEDSSIYVHIDSKVGHYVKVIMDEVFGERNFRNDIARIKCNPKNFRRRAYGNFKDTILFYTKGDNYVWNDPREPYTEEEIKELFPKVDEQGRRYTTNPLHAPGETKNGPTGKPWRGLMPPKGRHWRYPPEVLDELDSKGLIEWSETGNPRVKIYADEYVKKGKKRQDVWIFKDPPYPEYPTEKNLEMLKMIVEASSRPGDLVLDCFAGSGTTLIAAEELGRRWIGIDNSPIAIQISIKRLQALKELRPFVLYSSVESLPQTLQKILQQQSA